MRTLQLIVLLLAALQTPDVFAAIPPLSTEELRSTADLEIIGRVQRVYYRQRRTRRDHVDQHYMIDVKVTRVRKGDDVEVGSTIRIHGRSATVRPRNWGGDTGHRHKLNGRTRGLGALTSGHEVHCYLTREASSGWQILPPNGLHVHENNHPLATRAPSAARVLSAVLPDETSSR